MNKKIVKIFMIISLLVSLLLLGLIFVNSAFISAFMLWLSLFIFGICYYIKDDKRKVLLYGLFMIGVMLIIGALGYMVIRIK